MLSAPWLLAKHDRDPSCDRGAQCGIFCDALKVLASGVALLFAVTGLSGQEFLGTIEQKVRHMPNTYLWNEVHNRHLRMTRDPNDTSISALDPDRLDAMRKILFFPLQYVPVWTLQTLTSCQVNCTCR